LWVAIAAAGLAVAACGGDDGPSLSDLADSGGADQGAGDDEALDEFADALNQATGAGGGGSLTFDGTEHPIDSAMCLSSGGSVDVGTVGPDMYRIFVTGEPTDISVQILTPEGVQWFDGSPTQENKPTVTIDGNMITSTGGTFFNNEDDTLITAEFVIECPNAVL
jgi:hypothetical protein